jgi:hypothetical protein
MAMIENVIIPIFMKDFATMSWSIEKITLVALNDRSSVPFGHGVTITTTENTSKFLASANKKFVCMISIKTRTHKHIPVTASFVQVTTFKNI